MVGTRKNEIRFLDAGGLFALLDCLEVAPMILKRQIIGCLADLMEYKKAAKLFTQWNSQVTMKGALRLLLELWQSEQEAAGNLRADGVIADLEQPLNPRQVELEDADSTMTSTSRAQNRFRHAKNFADTLGGSIGSTASRTTVTKGFEPLAQLSALG